MARPQVFASFAEALAEALSLPHAGTEWAEALPEPPSRGFTGALTAELRWSRHYLLPWMWRHARGRSSGDGCRAKREHLEPVTVDSASRKLNQRSRLAE
mgnify:CR=1 FL=1